jgi:hypothetical protein
MDQDQLFGAACHAGRDDRYVEEYAFECGQGLGTLG